MNHEHRIITLTTDFGLADEYAGVMKGVILSILPGAGIVDLTHGIAPQNIMQAACVIDAAWRYFPAGTVHLVVVDPGVGTGRRLILLRAAEHYFLAPDNGVLTPLLDHYQASYELNRPDLFLVARGGTFQGRDILAPVAARLAAGMAPEEAGAPLRREDIMTLSMPAADVDDRSREVRGRVTGVDHFGNLLSNIHQNDCLRICAETPGGISRLAVGIKGRVIKGISAAYGNRSPGALLALIGSRGRLEVAVNQGSAARLLNAGPGDEVVVKRFTVAGLRFTGTA